jgi:hypothetical protein
LLGVTEDVADQIEGPQLFGNGTSEDAQESRVGVLESAVRGDSEDAVNRILDELAVA